MSCWPCHCLNRFKAKYILDSLRLLSPIIAPPQCDICGHLITAMRRLSQGYINPSVPPSSSYTPPLSSRPVHFSLLVIRVMDRVERQRSSNPQKSILPMHLPSFPVSPLSSPPCWDQGGGCRPCPHRLHSFSFFFPILASPLGDHCWARWWM